MNPNGKMEATDLEAAVPPIAIRFCSAPFSVCILLLLLL